MDYPSGDRRPSLSPHGVVIYEDNIFDKIKLLGRGRYGQAWLIRSQSDGRKLACKEIFYEDDNLREEMLESVKREQSLLARSAHPNIVKFYDFRWDHNYGIALIYMEYCAGGDLSRFIASVSKGDKLLTHEITWKIVFQLAAALAYCHHGLEVDKNRCFVVKPHWEAILHRDIKPENILVSWLPGGEIVVKLCDFGIGKLFAHEMSKSGTYIGTRKYMAPEITRDSAKWSFKADIYSLGRTLEKLTEINKSEPISGLIQDCLSMERADRPSSITLLEIAGHEVSSILNSQTNRVASAEENNHVDGICNVKGWKDCMFSTIIGVGSVENPPGKGHENEPITRLKMLLKGRGVDVNKVAEKLTGNTPLHVAAETGNYILAQRLLRLGADVKSVNNSHQTPLTLAEQQRDEKMVDMLRSWQPSEIPDGPQLAEKLELMNFDSTECGVDRSLDDDDESVGMGRLNTSTVVDPTIGTTNDEGQR